MRKKLLAFSVITLGLFLLVAGCGTGAQSAVRNYFTALSEGRYGHAYAQLAPEAKAKISEQDFVQRYSRVFDSLGLQALKLDGQKSGSDSDNIFCDISITAEELGTFSLTYEIPIVKTRDGWRLNWTPSMLLPGMDWEDTIVLAELKPLRGEIFDVKGRLLAENASGDTIYALADKIDDAAATAYAIAPILGMEQADVEKILNSKPGSSYPLILKVYAPGTLKPADSKALLQQKGIGLDSQISKLRLYHIPNGFSAEMGYLGIMPENQWDAYQALGYSRDDRVGIGGLEAAYEQQLRGKGGYDLYIRNVNGQKKKSVYTIPAENGLDLHLTVDIDLQNVVENAFNKFIPANQPGAVILLNSDNGDILSIANHPSFSSNLFVRGLSQAEWDKLIAEDAGHPLFNRALNGAYPPGSVLKPFVAAAALEANIVTPQTPFTGIIEDDRWTPDRSDWVYPPIKRVTNSGTPLVMANAMIQSDNIYFADIAIKMGQETYLSYMRRYGMEEAIPFAIPVATPSLLKQGTDFNIKLLADSGYGQGEIVISPLQQAAMFCAFNMEGSIPQPRIVSALYRTAGRDYKLAEEIPSAIWKPSVLQANTIETLKPLMAQVFTQGTGKGGLPSTFSGFGKTGTAEIGNDKSREISWVCALESTGENRLLALVILEVKAGQGAVKLDILKRVLLDYQTLQAGQMPALEATPMIAPTPTLTPGVSPTLPPTSTP